MLRGKGLKPIDSVKVTPAPFLKKTPLPGIHKSSSFHVAVDALEKKLGRAATHDEVKSELARRLKSTGEARAYSSSMRAQIERANEATDGDGWSHWKPWDYLDRSKLKRHHSEGKVIEVVEEGLGDDYQTSGEYVVPDITIAMKNRERRMFKGGKAPIRKLWAYEDMENMGPGIMLHFAFYKYMSRAFLIMMLLSVPMVVIAWSGNAILEPDTLKLSKLSLGNFGESIALNRVVPATNVTSGNGTVSRNKTETKYSLSPTMAPFFWDESVRWSRDAVMVLSSCLDVGSTLVLIVMGILFKEHIRKVTLKHKQDISAADYSVYVSSLPQDATREEITDHFDFLYRLDRDDWTWPGHCWGRGCGAKRTRKVEDITAPPEIMYDEETGEELEVYRTMTCAPTTNVDNTCDDRFRSRFVADCILVHPESHTLREFLRAQSTFWELKHARAQYKAHAPDSVHGHNEKECDKWSRKAGDLKTRHEAMKRQFVRMGKETRANAKDVRGCFVTFNHEESARRALEDYKWYSSFFGRLIQPKPLKFRGKFPLSVERADDPGNIQWQNLDTPFLTIAKRHCIGATLTIMLAAVSVLFQILVAFLDESMVNRSFDVYGAIFPVDLIFPTVTVSLNFFIVTWLYKFAKWEQHHSNAAESASVTRKVVFTLWVNVVLAPFILAQSADTRTQWGSYFFDVECYRTVLAGIAATMLFAVGTTNVKPFLWWICLGARRRWKLRSAVTQDELNRAFSGFEWKLEYRVPQVLQVLAICTGLGGPMPIMYAIGYFSMHVYWIVDRITLLKVANRPPTYDNRIALNVVEMYLPIATVLKLLFSIWTFATYQHASERTSMQMLMTVPVLLQVLVLVLYVVCGFAVGLGKMLMRPFVYCLRVCHCSAGVARFKPHLLKRYLPGFTETVVFLPTVDPMDMSLREYLTWGELTKEQKKDGWVVEDDPSGAGGYVRSVVYTDTTVVTTPECTFEKRRGEKMKTWEYIHNCGRVYTYNPAGHPLYSEAIKQMTAMKEGLMP